MFFTPGERLAEENYNNYYIYNNNVVQSQAVTTRSGTRGQKHLLVFSCDERKQTTETHK